MLVTKPKPAIHRIMPALVHIQVHLDQDLSLDRLAEEAQLSKCYFHQLFKRVTGETPKTYVERLRLERAALQLCIRNASVLEIALGCGFQNHETFTRAFREYFAMPPRDYRKHWASHNRVQRNMPLAGALSDGLNPQLSPTRVVRLARMIVAFVRHIGPHENVGVEDFDRLRKWAWRRGYRHDSPLAIGIAHDAPGITPTAKLRFDCCIRVPEVFAAVGAIGCQRTVGGEFAITNYVGSWDLKPAYEGIMDRLKRDKSIDIVGLPALEFYHATRIGPRHGLANVSIAIPVRSRAQQIR